MAMNRRWNQLNDNDKYPVIPFNCSGLQKKLKTAREFFMKEWFFGASYFFQYVLHVIPLTMLETQKEVDYIRQLRWNARSYLLVTKIQLNRKTLQNNLVRQLQLAAYSTHITLYASDNRKILFNAMTDCYKACNRETAVVLAKRLLEAISATNELFNRNENMRDERQLNHNFAKPFKFAVTINQRFIAADQVLQDSKENNTRDLLQINYDYAKPFKICGATFNPLFDGQSCDL